MRTLAILAASALLGQAVAAAEPARMVEDILTIPVQQDYSVTRFTGSGNLVYFFGPYGPLWRTDGTDVGTWVVAGVAPVGTGNLLPHDGVLYFGGRDGLLWRSEGTFETTRAVPPASNDRSFSIVDDLAFAGGTLFFTAGDAEHGLELWKSDGTSAGTVLVRDIHPGAGSSSRYDGVQPTALGGRVVLCADDGVHGREPWVSDGREGGTSLLRDIQPGGNSLPSCGGFVAAGGRLFFFADDGVHGNELWATDGTEAGTALVRDLVPGPASAQPVDLVSLGDLLLFTEGGRLWRSDGTLEGTVLVREALPVSGLTAASGRVFLHASESEFGPELWRTDGTAEGTVPVTELPGLAWNFCSLGDAVFFVVENVSPQGTELWRSDGTADGTALVRDIRPGSVGSHPFQLSAAGGRLYFSAHDGVHGREPWTSDGTAGGTVLLKDIAARTGSAPSRLIDVGGKLSFVTTNEHDSSDLWKSDGTAAGTERVTYVIGPQGPAASWQGKLFFTQYDWQEYYEPDDEPNAWVSDGTPEGTVRLTDLTGWLFVPRNDGVLFLGYDLATGYEPWKTDGTRAGTALLRELTPGPASGGLGIGTVGDHALLWSGAALWRSDGSAEGTTPLLQIYPEGTATWADFYPAGAVTYFLVEWSSLWRTDGTTEGTVQIAPIQDGGIRFFDPLGVVGENLFIGVTFDDGDRLSLWRTTSDATLVEVHERIGSIAQRPIPAAGGASALFLAGDDPEHGQELWKSDGTSEGTRLLRDIAPGPFGSSPRALTVVDGVLLFAASDGVHGSEVWRSDGSAEGTVLVQDIAPGPSSSNPNGFTVSGPRVFFSADDGVHGQELWAGWRGILTGNPQRALVDLREEVEGLGVPGLLAKIDAAASALERGDRLGAARMLGAFGRALGRMRDRQVPAGAVDSLADLAEQTIELLGGSSRSLTRR